MGCWQSSHEPIHFARNRLRFIPHESQKNKIHFLKYQHETCDSSTSSLNIYLKSFTGLNTAEKDETSRRVIVDLSWREGTSVYSCIDKDVYLGDDVSLTYPY